MGTTTEAARRLWEDPRYRQRMSNIKLGKKMSEESSRKKSEAMIRRYYPDRVAVPDHIFKVTILTEYTVQCPICKQVDTIFFEGEKFVPTRKFTYQVGIGVLHNCFKYMGIEKAAPCKILRRK